MWVWPQVPLGAPPLHPPCALGPLPPTSLRRPLPEPCTKSQGGWVEEGRRGRGGKGFGLREGSSNYNGGGGEPSKHQLGPDPHLGASLLYPCPAGQTKSGRPYDTCCRECAKGGGGHDPQCDTRLATPS